jgi:quinol monooxygenase YgiN
MVHVMASIVVQPEQAQAARTLLAGLAAESRREPGCLSYELFQRPDLPHVFRTVEQWQAVSDIDAHMRTPHVGKAIAAGQTMFAAPPEIVSYARVDAP